MITTYLFDWGNTLMVDFPDVNGKMCDWEVVEAIAGAKATLAALSQNANIYIATGAADSTEAEIKLAFDRVDLSQYISGYFCQENLGVVKGTPLFLSTIIDKLNQPLNTIAMVGDSFEKDIIPAIAVGILPIWLNTTLDRPKNPHVRVINKLSDLIDVL